MADPTTEPAAAVRGLAVKIRQTIRRGQRTAIRVWRDRTDAPGLMARFEVERLGTDRVEGPDNPWRFSLRRLSTDRKKMRSGMFRDFLFSGSLREQLRRREPVTATSGDFVVSTFAMGGGALNLLGAKKGVTARTIDYRELSVPRQGYTYTRKGGTVAVPAGTLRVRGRHITETPSERSYTEEFQDLRPDLPWVSDLADREIARSARAGLRAPVSELVRVGSNRSGWNMDDEEDADG
jgi:hypothetical protein